MQTPQQSLKQDEELFKLLTQTIVENNKVPFSEYQQYKVLYMDPQKSNRSMDELRTLSDAWFKRISPYREIQIVDDITGEVILTLPACLTDIGDLSEHALGAELGVAMDAMMGRIDREKQSFTDKVTPIAKVLSQAIKENVNEENVNKQVKIALEANRILKGGAIEKSDSTSNGLGVPEWND